MFNKDNRFVAVFVHDVGTDQETIELFKNLISEKQLNISIYAMLTDNHEVYDKYLKSGSFFDDKGYLIVRTIKLFLESALGTGGLLFFALTTMILRIQDLF